MSRESGPYLAALPLILGAKDVGVGTVANDEPGLVVGRVEFVDHGTRRRRDRHGVDIMLVGLHARVANIFLISSARPERKSASSNHKNN